MNARDVPSETIRRWVVRPIEDGWPLERFLMGRLNCSRRAARRYLDARAVFVNRRRVWMARHALTAGDIVELATERADPLGRQELLRWAAEPPLYADERLWIVAKPAGVVSTGEGGWDRWVASAHGLSWLRAAHRLDRETSGCLMLARSESALKEIVDWFRHGWVRKWYDAIVIGRVQFDRQVIRRPLDGQPALTRCQRQSAGDLASHLRLEIPTGRTHQIRRHLAAIGHPVLGDSIYAVGEHWPVELRRVPRLMLHASRIEFPAVRGGGRQRVSSMLPEDFQRELRRLGLPLPRERG